MGKVIHWKFVPKIEVLPPNKWYMHNIESFLENEKHKLLWDHLIVARRPALRIINKKGRTCRIVDFAVPADHRVKLKESEKKDKYPGPC